MFGKEEWILHKYRAHRLSKGKCKLCLNPLSNEKTILNFFALYFLFFLEMNQKKGFNAG